MFASNANGPTATLYSPVVLNLKESLPIATLEFAVVLVCKDLAPKAVLYCPVVFAANA